jgi:hypothetical protein
VNGGAAGSCYRASTNSLLPNFRELQNKSLMRSPGTPGVTLLMTWPLSRCIRRTRSDLHRSPFIRFNQRLQYTIKILQCGMPQLRYCRTAQESLRNPRSQQLKTEILSDTRVRTAAKTMCPQLCRELNHCRSNRKPSFLSVPTA